VLERGRHRDESTVTSHRRRISSIEPFTEESTMRMKHFTAPLALSLLALGACVDDGAPPESIAPPPTAAEFSTEVEIDGELRAVPISTLKLDDGATAAFYVWPDLSAGYLLTGPDDVAMPAGGALDDLSATEVFYAMSRGTTEIPTALLQHHAALAADGTRPAFGDAIATTTRGWFLDLPRTESLLACNNANFTANNCDVTGYAGVHCFTDVNGYYETIAFGGAGKTRKFAAAFCIDAGGIASDHLRYYAYCGGITAAIWSDNAHGSPAYGTFAWAAPNTANPRHWYHKGYITGDNRDWASRWGNSAACL
jgi:hypothetical protein